MTSTQIVRKEIARFLGSPDPEVICITGDWGVGKTYTWQAGLDEAKSKNKLGLKRYSYASLFGINSLDGLKLSLFENLQFLDAPAETLTEKGRDFLKGLTSKAMQYSQLAQGLPAIGQFLSKAGPLYFSAIQSQIVCIDDLERRGDGLELKDVFGLISFLREQRACKVVLLFNAEKLDDKEGFDTLFEKVIDAKLVFAPTSAEALDIALKADDNVARLLRQYCQTLDISNIRVIKKIERLVRQIVPLLKEFLTELTQQAVHSIVLFGWTKFQPTMAPPFSFYRVPSLSRHMARSESKEQVRPQEQKWEELLSEYSFMHMDEFDLELWKFVDTGVLDAASVADAAKKQNQKIGIQKKTGSLEKAWRPYHASFDDNIDEVTSSIVNGTKANVVVVSLTNLDATISLLNAVGKEAEAKDLLDFFAAKKPIEFWDRSDDPFRGVLFSLSLRLSLRRSKQKSWQ